MNYRTLALLGALFVGLVAFGGVAQAEEISGNVFYDDFSGAGTVNQWDPGIDSPVAFEVIFVRQLDAPAGRGFETAAFTDDMGFYTVSVPPGGRYEIVVPNFGTPGNGSGFKMYSPATGPTTMPTPLPSGVTVNPGENPTVDLPFFQGPAPAFAEPVAPDVPAAVVTTNSDIPPVPYPNMDRDGFFPPDDLVGGDSLLLNFLSGVELTMTPIDEDGNATGPAVVGTPLTSGFPGALFTAWPALTDGDIVRFEIDPAQAAVDGFGPVTPTTIDVTYTAGETLPPIEFRLKAVKDISGTVFLESTDAPDGVFNGTDKLLANVPVELYEFEAPAGAAPIATTTTDAAGEFEFENVFIGTYRVRAEPLGSLPAQEQARVLLGTLDPAPANFAFVGSATVNQVDMELCIPFREHAHGKHNHLHVLFLCRGQTDIALLKFSGDNWTGEANGKRGVIKVTSVELNDDGTQWKVKVTVRARDMSDGSLGAFPARKCRVFTGLNGKHRRVKLNFREDVEEGAVTNSNGDTLYSILKVLHLLN